MYILGDVEEPRGNTDQMLWYDNNIKLRTATHITNAAAILSEQQVSDIATCVYQVRKCIFRCPYFS